MMYKIYLCDHSNAFSAIDYFFGRSPIYKNINYNWNYGSLLGLILIIQIVTGVSLSFHYIPTIDKAFDSIQDIMIEQNYGYLLRYAHSNGASLFFMVVYLHIGRSLYYGSYHHPRILVWNIGVVIFILMMATAFLGYVLVWGSMSLWGAIVITNFFTVIPWIGIALVYFIWGGFSVDFPTLNRFYGLHYSFPWIILGLVILHILALHSVGGNNPLTLNIRSFLGYFHPLFTYKDTITFLLFFIIYIYIIGFYPNVLGHPDNYIKANPLVTPSSIVPEWYFLPFYAILRSVSDKTYGVVLMGLSIAVLFTLPWTSNKDYCNSGYTHLSRYYYYSLIASFIFLLIMGSMPLIKPYIIASSIACSAYFHFFSEKPLLSTYYSSIDCK